MFDALSSLEHGASWSRRKYAAVRSSEIDGIMRRNNENKIKDIYVCMCVYIYIYIQLSKLLKVSPIAVCASSSVNP